MSNLFRSQSQQQQQQQSNNGNTFNRKNPVTTTTKKTPAAAIYMHNEANFPEFISTKKEDVTDTKPATAPATMYANVVSTVISHTLVVDSTVPAGWTQITLDKKTHKMEVIEVIESTDFKKQNTPENTTNKIIKELDYRWYRYKVEYDLIYGENAFHEAHYTAPIYPYLDAELDTDSELSDHSNEYDNEL